MTFIQIKILISIGVGAGILFWLGFLYWNRDGGGSYKRLLPVFFAVGLICRIAFVFGTPDFYAPDEESHFNYIRFLTENRSFPIQQVKMGAPTNDWEYYQPPLYYLAQVPVYVLSKTLFQDDRSVLRTLRFFSVVLWIATVWFTVRFIRILGITDDFLRVFLAGMVCLLPTYTFLSAMINNDNMLIVIGAYLLCSIARRDLGMKSAIVKGILLGLALLAKSSAVVYCPAVVAVVVFQVVGKPEKWRLAAGHLFLVVFISALIWLPWAARNLYLYNFITAESVASIPVQWPSMAHAIDGTIKKMFITFWAVSGKYNNVDWYFPFVGILLSVFSLFGLFNAVLSEKSLKTVFADEVNGGVMTAMALSVAVNAVLVFMFGIQYGQGQGRFMLPLLIPLSLFLGIGLRNYSVKNLSIHVAGLLIAYAVSFTLFCLGMFTRMGADGRLY